MASIKRIFGFLFGTALLIERNKLLMKERLTLCDDLTFLREDFLEAKFDHQHSAHSRASLFQVLKFQQLKIVRWDWDKEKRTRDPALHDPRR